MLLPLTQMIDRYTIQEKIHMKIFMSDVSAYNTHPDFRPDFEENNAYYTRKITVYSFVDMEFSII